MGLHLALKPHSMGHHLLTAHCTCFRRTFMTESNRFDLLTNTYIINAFVINILKNKCICLSAQINLIYSQMHIK